jgi:hypothetical protein
LAREVTCAELAKAAVGEAARSGRWTKIIGDFLGGAGPFVPNWPADVLAEAVAQVHAAGGRVAVHAVCPDAVDAAVAAGVDSVEHGWAVSDAHFAAMRARNTAWVPTLMPGGSEAACEFAAAIGFSVDTREWMRTTLDAQPATVARAPAAGVTVLAGTDAGQGPHGTIAVFGHELDADPGREHGFLPIMLTHAGRACLLAGDLPAARGHLDQALQIAQTRSWAGVTAAPLALLGHVAVATGDHATARDLLEEAFARACQVGDPCWETLAAHGLGLNAAASGDRNATLRYLTDAVARSRPSRGGHLWSYVWALADAARLGRRLGDPRHVAWQDEALATAQRCGMRALTNQLLQNADSA